MYTVCLNKKGNNALNEINLLIISVDVVFSEWNICYSSPDCILKTLSYKVHFILNHTHINLIKHGMVDQIKSMLFFVFQPLLT